jgi:hypothetical protein
MGQSLGVTPGKWKQNFQYYLEVTPQSIDFPVNGLLIRIIRTWSRLNFIVFALGSG